MDFFVLSQNWEGYMYKCLQDNFGQKLLKTNIIRIILKRYKNKYIKRILGWIKVIFLELTNIKYLLAFKNSVDRIEETALKIKCLHKTK